MLTTVTILGMTCFRCVNAINAVISELPLLMSEISLENNEGTFVCDENLDANTVVAVINSMGTKFSALIK